MKYDAEKCELSISEKELVEIARRGISSHAPHDSDEPSLTDARQPERFIPKEALSEKLNFSTTIRSAPLTVYGTADGIKDNELYCIFEYESGRKNPTKEEVSTARAEAFILGFMLAKKNAFESVKLNIVYINPKTSAHITSIEVVNFTKLNTFFERCLKLAENYAEPEIERVTVRLPSMKNARFPYGKVREGQHEFITSVYKNLTRGGTLFAAAPTGTGKTVSVIYPAIRALGTGKAEKIFYFTPKTTAANAAKECITALADAGVKSRALILSSKERLCRRGLLCRESKRLCPTSRENNIIKAALELYRADITVVTDKEIRSYADKYSVCPHELSLTYSELSDIVICDINYLFDPRVRIKRYFSHGGRYYFLIDEAHNLPDRAREIYSAAVSEDDFTAPLAADILGEHSALRVRVAAAYEKLSALLFPYIKDEIRCDKDGIKHGFTHISEPPARMYEIFEELAAAAETELFSAMRAKDDECFLRIAYIKEYSALIKSVNTALELFDDGYEMFIFYDAGKIGFKLFAIDTSKPIRDCLAKGQAAVFFSATLAPLSYYRSVLGGDGSSGALEISSPFDSSQLCVTVMDKISTRYSEREDTLGAVCRAIAACVSARRGHYMIFSPSFAYSEALAKAFAAKYPKIKTLIQNSGMSPAEKREFLSEFEKNPDTYLVAFCVTGGIFSEGIDLVGESLIGAVIVGIAMPSLSYEREAIAAYYDEKCDEGKQYAYIYPGMNRVFQAAGRVIRREGDRGVVVLIDDRFADPIYKKSIPDLWGDMAFADDAKLLRQRLDEFWSKNAAEK